MALKYRITKTAFDKLDDAGKENYEADGDKHYTLAVEGLDDNGALKRAKERADQEVVDLKADLKAANAEVTTLKASQGEGGADVARLTRSHERKIATITEAHEKLTNGLKEFIKKTLKGSKAKEMATAISTVPSLLADKIEARMDVNFDGDEPVLVINNAAGAADPTLTLDKLKAEFVANPEFKSILVGNRATGSAAPIGVVPVQGATPSAIAGQQTTANVDVNTLDNKSFVERVKAKHEAAQAAKAAAGASAQ